MACWGKEGIGAWIWKDEEADCIVQLTGPGPQEALELDHRIQGTEKENRPSMYNPMAIPSSYPRRDSHCFGGGELGPIKLVIPLLQKG